MQEVIGHTNTTAAHAILSQKILGNERSHEATNVTVVPMSSRSEGATTLEEATTVLPESNYVATETPFGDTFSTAPTSPAVEPEEDTMEPKCKKLRLV